MRRTFGMQARFNRVSTFIGPALVGSAGLVLAACAGDSPTSTASSEDVPNLPTAAFTVTPGSGATSRMGTLKLSEQPTIQVADREQGTMRARGQTNSPWNLTYLGGPFVTSATSWNIYTNCAVSCWSTGSLTPATLLFDLNRSSLIQVANQYLGEDAAGQFSVQQLSTTYTFTDNTAQLSDIFNIIASAVASTGATGYTNIYHVFLPPGTDMCINSTECYSPDNLSTFEFCAFHASVDFGSTHVLFSVQPYQAVPGCPLPTQTRLIDATASTLSHEFMEAVTDPDGDAWVSLLTGNEVADLCFGFRVPVRLNRHVYVVQQFYSNQIQDCTSNSFSNN